MAQKKLLHVFSTFNIGGPQVRFAQMANAWGKDYCHQIIAMDNQTDCASLLNENVPFEILTPPNSSGGLISRLKAIRQLLINKKSDLLITYNWGAIEWALARWFSSTPHIHIEDGFGPEEQSQQIPRRVLFRKLALKGAHKVIVPSMTLYRIAEHHWKIPKRKLQFIANGVNVKKLSESSGESFAEVFNNSHSLNIGTLARIRKEKNIPRLINAFEQLDQLHKSELWIAGDGPELETIAAFVQSSPLSKKIHLVGNVKFPAEFLKHLDIFALSSDTEQMPYSVLEAAACGKAIASVNVGDVKSLVSKDNEKFVNGSSSDDLLKSLKALASDDSLRKSVGESNHEYCKNNFDESVMLNLYRENITRLTTSELG